MTLKTIFTASALVAALMGLGLMFAPEPLITARTGQPPDVLTAHIAAQFGIAMLAVGLISWLARSSPDSAARNALVTGLTLLYLLLPIETAISIARGSESQEGLLLVAVFGLLAAGFVLVGKPRLRG